MTSSNWSSPNAFDPVISQFIRIHVGDSAAQSLGEELMAPTDSEYRYIRLVNTTDLLCRLVDPVAAVTH